MPLYWFALLIAVLFSGSSAHVLLEFDRPVLTLVGVLLAFCLMAKMLALAAAREILSGANSYVNAHRRLQKRMETLRWIWLPMGAVGLTIASMKPLFAEVEWFEKSMAFKAIVLLIPSLLATSATWLAEREFLNWADDQHEPSNQKGSGRPRQHVVRYLIDSLRMQCGWLLLPVIIVLAVIDLAQLGLSASDHFGAATGLIGLAVLPIALPLTILMIWDTQKIDAPWLDEIVRTTGLGGMKVRVWNTNNRVCSALVAGFLPRFRVLLLSDSLLQRLPRAGIALVVLHELAHIRRFHMALRMLALIPAWGCAAVISNFFPLEQYATVFGMAIGVVLTFAAICFISHKTELDADRYACRMASQLEGAGEFQFTESEAARTLIAALAAVSSDHPKASKASWMHPSLDTRIQRLQRLVRDDYEASQRLAALPT